MLIYACDGLDQIGQITDWSRLKLVERDLDVGNWSITVPLDGAGADVVRTWRRDDVDAWIEVFDPTTGWRFGGPSIQKETVIGVDGGTVTMRGVDHMAHLARRLVVFDPVDPDDTFLSNTQISYDVTGTPGRALSREIHSLVFEQIHEGFGGVNAYRRIPNLSGFFEDEPGLGVMPTYRVEAGTFIIEQIQQLTIGEDFTVRFRLDRRSAGGVEQSTLRFSTPPRTLANMRLSVSNGGYEQVVVTETRAPSTHTIVIGTKEEFGPRPFYAGFQPGAGSGSWGRELYGEQYLDRDGFENETLGWEWLAELRKHYPKSTVAFKGVDVEGFGQRVDIGWLVPAEVTIAGRTDVYELPVSAAELSGTPGDLRRKISVGEQQPSDVSRVLELMRRMESRLRRVERRG